MDKYKRVKELIEEAKTITILSGAGVSTASGIPDFRSRGGLYGNIAPEEILSRGNFERNNEQFWKDYKEIFGEKINSEEVKPNIAHKFPKYLKELGKKVYVITQNVDGLYDGFVEEENLIEYHGNIKKLICKKCKKEYEAKEYLKEEEIPKCEICKEILNVNVVLFGDDVREHYKAWEMVQDSDVIFVMGTKLAVQPFSNLITGNRTRKNILLNNENIYDKRFEVKLLQDISKSIEKIIKTRKEEQK